MPLPLPVRPWHGEQNTLKRSWPRAITSAVTGIGKVVASWPLTLPSFRGVASRSVPGGPGLGPGQARPLPVGEEGARLERFVARRVVHVLTTAREGNREGDEADDS